MKGQKCIDCGKLFDNPSQVQCYSCWSEAVDRAFPLPHYGWLEDIIKALIK